MQTNNNPRITSILRLADRGGLSKISADLLSQKLLDLYLADTRRNNGLHLRWQRKASIELAMLTVNDLRTQLKKRKNKAAKLILDGLEKLQGNKEAAAVFLIAAEEVLKTESEKQKERGNTPKREDPLNAEIRKILTRQSDITTREIIDRLTSQAGNGGVIIDYDDHFIIYKESKPPHSEHSAAISGMQTRVNRVKKNMLKGIKKTS